MDAEALGIIALFTGVGLLFTGIFLAGGLALLRHQRRALSNCTKRESDPNADPRASHQRERQHRIWIGVAWLLIIAGSIGMFLAASCGAGFLFGM